MLGKNLALRSDAPSLVRALSLLLACALSKTAAASNQTWVFPHSDVAEERDGDFLNIPGWALPVIVGALLLLAVIVSILGNAWLRDRFRAACIWLDAKWQQKLRRFREWRCQRRNKLVVVPEEDCEDPKKASDADSSTFAGLVPGSNPVAPSPPPDPPATLADMGSGSAECEGEAGAAAVDSCAGSPDNPSCNGAGATAVLEAPPQDGVAAARIGSAKGNVRNPGIARRAMDDMSEDKPARHYIEDKGNVVLWAGIRSSH